MFALAIEESSLIDHMSIQTDISVIPLQHKHVSYCDKFDGTPYELREAAMSSRERLCSPGIPAHAVMAVHRKSNVSSELAKWRQ